MPLKEIIFESLSKYPYCESNFTNRISHTFWVSEDNYTSTQETSQRFYHILWNPYRIFTFTDKLISFSCNEGHIAKRFPKGEYAIDNIPGSTRTEEKNKTNVPSQNSSVPQPSQIIEEFSLPQVINHTKQEHSLQLRKLQSNYKFLRITVIPESITIQ